MNFIILVASLYVFLETAITGCVEYSQNKNRVAGIILYVVAVFCLVVPSLVI